MLKYMLGNITGLCYIKYQYSVDIQNYPKILCGSQIC